ncbi:hypothetical protein PROFUN_16486, partial [Planoprotostelium fungivorum]
VLDFILEHSQVVDIILRNHDPSSSDSVRIVTAVLSLLENVLREDPNAYPYIMKKSTSIINSIVQLFGKYTERVAAGRIDSDGANDRMDIDLSQQIVATMRALSDVTASKEQLLFISSKTEMKPTVVQLASQIESADHLSWLRLLDSHNHDASSKNRAALYWIAESLVYILYKQIELNGSFDQSKIPQKALGTTLNIVIELASATMKTQDGMDNGIDALTRSCQLSLRQIRDLLQ